MPILAPVVSAGPGPGVGVEVDVDVGRDVGQPPLVVDVDVGEIDVQAEDDRDVGRSSPGVRSLSHVLGGLVGSSIISNEPLRAASFSSMSTVKSQLLDAP